MEYASAVKRIAVGLRAIGVAQNDGIGLLSANEIYYYVLGDGAVAAGGTFCPIPTDGDEHTLGRFIQAAQVSWLFVGVESLEKALLAARLVGIDESRVIVFDPPGLKPYGGARPRFSSLLNADESLFQNPYQGKDPKKLICVRLFGSGTSGMVKAAEISHAAQLARLDTPLFTRSPRDTTWLHYMPLALAPGHNMCVRACAGRLPVSVTSVDDAPTLLEKIQAGRCSQIQLPPALMEAMTDAINSGLRSRETLQSMETILIGGTFARKDSVAAFTAILPSHTRLRTGYGCTESGIVTMTPIDAPWVQGYTGFLTRGVELK